MLFRHSILSRDAKEFEKVQKLTLKIVKGHQHVPYEASLLQLRLFSFTHRRIRGDLTSMFKIAHGLLEFAMESTFIHPIRKGLRGHAYKFRHQGCCTRRRQFTLTIRAVPFWNASSVKSSKTLLDAHCSPKYPSKPPPPTAHSLSTPK